MLRLALLASTAIAWPSVAMADPIFTPLLIAAGVSGSLFGVSTVAILSSVLTFATTAAIGIGYQLLFGARPPKPENGIVPTQQPIPSRIFGWGTARVPGVVMLKENSASNILCVVTALNAHKVDSFVGLYLNDDKVQVGVTSDGFLAGPVGAMPDGRYRNNAILISTRRGLATENVYANIVQLVPSAWGATFRGDGCSSLAMTCAGQKKEAQQQVFPNQQPQPSAVIRQYRVFDPRDSSQSPSNPATFKYSDNAALCYLHFRCFSEFGSLRDYSRCIAPVVNRWIAAANACDDAMALKGGGTEKRYRVGGWTTADQERRTVESGLRMAMDGWTVERGDGTIDIQVGKYVAPTVFITDADIIGVSLTQGTPAKDRIDRITAKYTSENNDYVTAETTPIDDLISQATRSGPPRATQMDLTWCPATGQASRLQKRELKRQSTPLRGTLFLKMSAMNACYERWVGVTSNSISQLANIVIENHKPDIFPLKDYVSIEFIISGPDIDDYNPAIDQSDPPVINSRIQAGSLPTPANLNVIPEQVGGSIYLDVSCDQPLDTNGNAYAGLSYQVQYRLSDAGGGNPGSWVPVSTSDQTSSGGRVSVQTGNVPPNALIDVQMVSTSSGTTLSIPSNPVQVNTALSAPGRPTGIDVSNGTGSVQLTAHAPASSSFQSVQFFRNLTGGTFATSQAIGQPVVGVSGGTCVYTDVVDPGTYDYWATASDGITSSAPFGPVTGTSS